MNHFKEKTIKKIQSEFMTVITNPKLMIFTLIMIGFPFLTSWINKNPILNFEISDRNLINTMFNYQIIFSIISIFCLLVIYLFSNKVKLAYLNFYRNGKMNRSVLLGVKKDSHWEIDGWGYGVIVFVTIVMYSLVTIVTNDVTFNFSMLNTLLVIPIAAANAFNEEVLYRLSFVTMGANETNSNFYGLFMSAVVFGCAHYFGFIPNGLLGALMSGYLGFLLSKSMQETKGMYWAFFIHFLLDVGILMFFFNILS